MTQDTARPTTRDLGGPAPTGTATAPSVTPTHHRTDKQGTDQRADGPWADVQRTRRAPVRGRVARALVGRAVRDLDLQLVLPDGTVLGSPGAGAPRLEISTERFFDRIGADLSIGVGEGFQAGEWAPAPGSDLADVLTPLAERLTTLVPGWLKRFRRVLEPSHPADEGGDPEGARSNIARHYDLSNDLFATFLDETMSYSGARFEGAEAQPGEDLLAAAQRHKVDGVLDLAGVRAGSRVLEIGTGWGQLAIQAAGRGARVHSITLSAEQARLAQERVAAAGLGDRVTVEVRDYRDIRERYDAVVSVEMIEAVGYDYWDAYFAAVRAALVPGGRFGLQAITMPHEVMLDSRHAYTWIHKYIFPGGLIPSVEAIEEAAARAGLRIDGRRRMGDDYARTLREWRSRFRAGAERVGALGFDAQFQRVWEYYLAYSEAGFRAGHLDVWQFGLDAGAGSPAADAGGAR
ncbi:SAM-dependent methyltransferase [Ornithinicoccus hortensis]|uniref:Cyclopropane-fatty-acyl-phospholipid synthase n=1 Tax=Ornithinicoccus hortensis TaxID=82346 RepID=A0A542YQP5_9MICO|nr:cyclopropane-fatty-acyl-phospholipid synthase family protein [Ornithinicoccus hortensis]TQL50420.1 cyclopropane-fatty-acyl-phospholipid synthase [Ornithinicoccus hortensis]